MKRASALLPLVALFASPAAWAADPIEPANVIEFAAMGRGVSDDARYVVGSGRGAYGTTEAFRWSPAGGFEYAGKLPGGQSSSTAFAASDDGSVVVGQAYVANGNGTYATQGFRWSAGGALTPIGRQPDPGQQGQSWAYDVNSDGTILVGSCDYFRSNKVTRPVSWTAAGQFVDLGPPDDLKSAGFARGVSGDGSVIVGQYGVTSVNPAPRAFRWTRETGFQDLGTLPGEESEKTDATGVSRDGKVVIGNSGDQAFVWTEEGGFERLTPLERPTGNACAVAVSRDGRVIYGMSSPAGAPTNCVIWILEGSVRKPYSVYDLLEDGGADMSAWTRFIEANAMSGDGRVLTGIGFKYPVGTPSGPFRAYIPLPNQIPVVSSPTIDADEVLTVKLGQTLDAAFEGRDADLDPLTFEADGLPGAVFDPPSGTTRSSPFNVELSFRPGLAEVGTHHASVRFKDSADDSAQLAFTIVVPPNVAPTLSTPSALTFECQGEQNLITLNASVGDADGHPLTVRWLVDGKLIKTASNVPPGTNAQLTYDFPDGVSSVAVRVTDGFSPFVEQSATVTVQDTTDPVVVVAPTARVSTDPGLDYASKFRLPKPQVNDVCDGDPKLINDAPDILPIGQYRVTWTVRDFSGNESTATQTIIVEDREAPRLLVKSGIKVLCDRGQPYATVKLPNPDVVDNVSPSPTVRSNARPRYPIGRTVVTWTATDQAGNVGVASMNVTVVNRRPKANAGADIVVRTNSERGARVRLNGSRSTDPDAHVLKYSWSARGTKFGDPRSKTPQGTFRVGKTTVKLTVTDEGGAKHSDTMTVTVLLNRGSGRRSQGAEANRAFSSAASAAAEGVRSGSSGAGVLRGYRDAAAADRFGIAAGEFVRWEEGESETDALTNYAELRYRQALHGSNAARAFLQEFAECGDEDAMSAGLEAVLGLQAAAMDLMER